VDVGVDDDHDFLSGAPPRGGAGECVI
jgi:hypothetical protein